MTGRDTLSRPAPTSSYPVRDELTPRAASTAQAPPWLRRAGPSESPSGVSRGAISPNSHLPFTIEQADMKDHSYLDSGWCVCGHHREDGRNERDPINPPTLAEIRAILGPTYQPKDDHEQA